MYTALTRTGFFSFTQGLQRGSLRWGPVWCAGSLDPVLWYVGMWLCGYVVMCVCVYCFLMCVMLCNIYVMLQCVLYFGTLRCSITQ